MGEGESSLAEYWSEEEVEQLKEGINNGLTHAEISIKLGRSIRAIANKSRKLGLTNRGLAEKHKEYILNNYEHISIEKMAETLKIAPKTISQFLKSQGLANKRMKSVWTDEDIETLRILATTDTIEDIAKRMGRSTRSVWLKAHRMGIVIKSMRHYWTPDEDEYLKENWGIKRMDYLCNKLNRSQVALEARAKTLGLTNYTEAKIDNSPHLVSLSEFCTESGISKDRILGSLSKKYGFPLVKKHMTANGIKVNYFIDLDKSLNWLKEHPDLYDATKISKYLYAQEPKWLRSKRLNDSLKMQSVSWRYKHKEWKEHEIALLKSMVLNNYSTYRIAKKLNRHPGSVYSKMKELCLKSESTYFWSEAQNKYLIDNWETQSDRELAVNLNKTVKAVSKHRHKLGLYREYKNKTV